MPFVRPELFALSGLLVLVQVQGAWIARTSTLGGVQSVGRLAAAPLLAALPWTVAASGTILPATAAAKRVFFAQGCEPFLLKVGTVLEQGMEFHAVLGVASFGVALLAGVRRGIAPLVFAAAFYIVYFVALPGGLGHYEQRYLYLLFPSALLGIASALRASSALSRQAATAILVLGLCDATAGFREHFRRYYACCRNTLDSMEPSMAFAREHLPRDARILVHDAGLVSERTPFVLYDLVGLKTPSSTAFHRARTWPTCGAARGEAVVQIALSHPDARYLIVLRGWYDIERTLRDGGWAVEPLYRSLSGSYDIFKIAPPRERP